MSLKQEVLSNLGGPRAWAMALVLFIGAPSVAFWLAGGN